MLFLVRGLVLINASITCQFTASLSICSNQINLVYTSIFPVCSNWCGWGLDVPMDTKQYYNANQAFKFEEWWAITSREAFCIFSCKVYPQVYSLVRLVITPGELLSKTYFMDHFGSTAERISLHFFGVHGRQFIPNATEQFVVAHPELLALYQ